VWIYKANEAKTGYPTGHWTNAALLLMVAVGCGMLRVYYGWKNRQLIREQGQERVRLYKY